MITYNAARDLYSLYQLGVPVKLLANMARVTEWGVYSAFKRYRLYCKEARRRGDVISANAAQIYIDLQNGISVDELVKKHNLTAEVAKYLKRFIGYYEVNKLKVACPEKQKDDMNKHLFCCWCPLAQYLPCADWECDRCENSPNCPCFNPNMRDEEWERAYQKWKLGR